MALSVTTFPTGGLDGVYFEEVNPPPNIIGAPSSVLGAVISASRGPLNVAQSIGSAAALANTFGTVTTGLVGYLDVLAVLQQGASNIWVTRVASDGVTAANFTVNNSSSAAELYLEAISPGLWGNSLNVAIAAGSVPTTSRLTISNTATNEINFFDNLVLTTAAGIAAAITTINSGSTLVRSSQPIVTNPTTAPTLATATSGGTVPAATYYVSTSWYNTQGETFMSPEAVITTTGSTSTLTVTPGDSLPTGAVGFNIYIGSVSGSKTYSTQSTGIVGLVLTTAAQAAPAGRPHPFTNTATQLPTSVVKIAVSAAGTGYTSVPTVTITGGAGSGATATAVLSTTTVGYVYITNPGTGYTSAPTIGFTGGGGSSATATATVATQNVGAPTTGATNAFTSGANGNTVSTTAMLGAAGTVNTGAYTLAGVTPAPFLVFLGTLPKVPGATPVAAVGGDDSTAYASLVSLAANNGWIALLTAPQGTSPAVVATLTSGIDTDYGVFIYPWQKYTESVAYKSTVLVSPLGFYAGEVATETPNQSPGNKTILASTGPEYVLSAAQMTTLIDPSVRIVPVGQFIPSGGIGIVSGINMSTNSAINQVFERRMKTFIERSFLPVLGQFVDEPITQDLFATITNVSTQFLASLASQGLIGDSTGQTLGYAVYCNSANNPSGSIQQGVVNVNIQVILLNSAQQIRVTFQVGPTVVLSQPSS